MGHFLNFLNLIQFNFEESGLKLLTRVYAKACVKLHDINHANDKNFSIFPVNYDTCLSEIKFSISESQK